MRMSTLFAVAALGLAALPAHAGEASAELPAGAYRVEVRLELPNLEAWAARSTATICIPRPDGDGALPLPILSRNNPLAGCPASEITRDGESLVFNVRCEGRGAARAHAIYTLAPTGFRGRILMIMGGKNMVMTEVQAGRRIGECASASVETDQARRSK